MRNRNYVVVGIDDLHLGLDALAARCQVSDAFPRGAKYPTFKVSGSKTRTLHGIWDPRP